MEVIHQPFGGSGFFHPDPSGKTDANSTVAKSAFLQLKMFSRHHRSPMSQGPVRPTPTHPQTLP